MSFSNYMCEEATREGPKGTRSLLCTLGAKDELGHHEFRWFVELPTGPRYEFNSERAARRSRAWVKGEEQA